MFILIIFDFVLQIRTGITPKHEEMVPSTVITSMARLHYSQFNRQLSIIWDKVFKNGPSKICGRQPLKNLKRYGVRKADYTPSHFLKAVFHKFYSVHSLPHM